MERLMAWLDRRFGFILIMGTALLLASAAWTSIHPAALEDAYEREFTLHADGHDVILALNRPSDKPSLIASEGRRLYEVQATESYVIVNGTRTSLERLTFNAASDGRLTFASWSSPDYALELRIAATPDGAQLDWSWARGSNGAAQDVHVVIVQYAHRMLDASYDGGSATWVMDSADPLVAPHPPTLPAGQAYAVGLRIEPAPQRADFLPPGETPDALRTSHAFTSDQAATSAPIARYGVSFDRIVAPPPPELPTAERATPRNATLLTRDVELVYGGLTATVALGTPAYKPVVRIDELAVADINAREVRLIFEDEEVPLSDLDLEVYREGPVAYLLWHADSFTVREVITLNATSLDVAWSLHWKSGAAREGKFEVVHFAPYLRDLTPTQGGFAYDVVNAGMRVARVDVLTASQSAPQVGTPTSDGYDAFRLTVPLTPSAQTWAPLLNTTFTPRTVTPTAVEPMAVPDQPPASRTFATELTVTSGDYRTTVALNRPADRPSVASPQGRTLVDITAWDSLVRVGDVETPLAKLPSITLRRGNDVIITWEGDGYHIIENVSTRTDGVAVRWSWLPTDARAVRGTLDIAHFAIFMRNATATQDAIRYDLTPEHEEAQPSGDAGTRPGYAVHIALLGNVTSVRLGDTDRGVDAARVLASVTGELGRMTLLFEEHITFTVRA